MFLDENNRNEIIDSILELMQLLEIQDAPFKLEKAHLSLLLKYHSLLENMLEKKIVS